MGFLKVILSIIAIVYILKLILEYKQSRSEKKSENDDNTN